MQKTDLFAVTSARREPEPHIVLQRRIDLPVRSSAVHQRSRTDEQPIADALYREYATDMDRVHAVFQAMEES